MIVVRLSPGDDVWTVPALFGSSRRRVDLTLDTTTPMAVLEELRVKLVAAGYLVYIEITHDPRAQVEAGSPVREPAS